MILFLSFFNLFIIGSAFVEFTTRQSKSVGLTIRMILSIIAGAGLTTLTYFLFLLIFGRYDALYIFFETIISIFCCFFIVRGFNFHFKKFEFSLASLIFCSILFIALIFIIFYSLYHPHGEGDSITIWNLRARFIFLGRDNWKNAFNSLLAYSHPNYPPFLPLLISRFWSFNLNDSVFFPMMIAIFSVFTPIFLIFCSLYKKFSPLKALTASFILLGTTAFLTHGASQFADIPLALILLTSLILAYFFDKKSPKLLILIGFISSFLVFTKNEGVTMYLFFAAIFLFKKSQKEILYFVIGSLPNILAILYFKHFLAPPDDIFANQNLMIIFGKIINPERHQIIAIYFIKNMFVFGNWKINPFIFLIPFLVINLKSFIRNSFQTRGFLIIFFILASEYFIYLISPYELTWHLQFSFNRLMLQIWPSFLFLSFL
jgi:hypothetical protein